MTPRPIGRGPRRVTVVAVLALAVGLPACDQSRGGSNADSTVPEVELTPSASSSASTSSTEVLDELRAAVEQTSAAAAGSFRASVHAVTETGTVDLQLAGTWDGRDRTLDLTTAGETVHYEIVDGEATVDRGQGPKPITLDEVPERPTLERLAELDDPTRVADGVVRGQIDPSLVLQTDGAGAAGPVDVEVQYVPGGTVRSFTLTGARREYRATVSFTDLAT